MTMAFWILIVTALLLAVIAVGLAIFAAWTTRRVEKGLPPPGRFIDVDGTDIHYVDEGAGPAIVLIHGLSGHHRHFMHSLLERLQRDHRVIIVDRPGCGYSARPRKTSAAIAEQAQLIARFIAALELKRPVVVGHSLGGAIALSLAANHPEQVAGLALLAPVTHKPADLPPLFRGLAIRSPLRRWIVAWTLAIPMSIANRDFVLDTAFGPQPAPRDYATKGGGLLNLRPRNFIAASRDLIAVTDEQSDLTESYSRIKVPVGVLFGADDRILDPVAHQAALVAKLPDAHCELIDSAGHMIPITSADRCTQFIVRVAQRAAGASETIRLEKELA